MTIPSQPPSNSLQQFRQLARSLRGAAENRDYAALGTLLGENLQPDTVNVMVYINTAVGHLTILSSYVQLWSPLTPNPLSHEATIDDMARVLRSAARR
jgi:hypothetical protein